MGRTWDNVVELVWLYMAQHEHSYLSTRVVMDLLRSDQLYGTALINGHGDHGVTFTGADRLHGQPLRAYLVQRGCLIKQELPVPPGGAGERRMTYMSGREPHYYVADKVVWDAISTSIRLAGLQMDRFGELGRVGGG